jgi:hypothetical protein
MTEKELIDATAAGIFKSVLSMDAFSREHYEARRRIPAEKFYHSPPKDDEIFPKTEMVENGFVFDPLANHALYYYTVGLAEDVRCVGRWIASGLPMDESDEPAKPEKKAGLPCYVCGQDTDKLGRDYVDVMAPHCKQCAESRYD